MARFKDYEVATLAREALADQPDFFRDIMQATLQRLLEEEISKHVNADLHERTVERRGYRNGYRERHPKTRVGALDSWCRWIVKGRSGLSCSSGTSAVRRRW